MMSIRKIRQQHSGNHPLKNDLPKKAMIALASLITIACAPPENIFTTEPGTDFNASSGTVVIAGLTSSTSVCYTTDGSEPEWNNGTCEGGTTQRIPGPVITAQIPLSCGSETGDNVERVINVQYDWSGTAGYVATANYYLDCSTGGSGGGESPSGTNTMTMGQSLKSDEYLVSSNGQYRFYLQGDGNLVLRDWQTRESIWSSKTHGQNGTRLTLQSDSNLVLYTDTGSPVWASNTVGAGADKLHLNDDGTLGLLQGTSAVWSVGEPGSGGGGTGGSGAITHIGTNETYDSDGQNVRISRPSGSKSGDLMVLVLHRTDDYLPLRVDGWTRAAECFKRDNGYNCVTYDDCVSWKNGEICESFGDYGRGGRDLAQTIFYRKVGSSEPNSYTFNMNPDSSGHPGWAILTALRGANTSDPIRDWANEGCDGIADSLFPSVYGVAGDMVLLSQSFDDAVAQSKFGAPTGTTTFGYVSQSDEAGFLFGGILESTGETGTMKSHGDGASSCKDALVSLTIKSQ